MKNHTPFQGRKKVKCACIPCMKSKLGCDQARPCSRCVRKKTEHLCVDKNAEQVYEAIPVVIEQAQPMEMDYELPQPQLQSMLALAEPVPLMNYPMQQSHEIPPELYFNSPLFNLALTHNDSGSSVFDNGSGLQIQDPSKFMFTPDNSNAMHEVINMQKNPILYTTDFMKQESFNSIHLRSSDSLVHNPVIRSSDSLVYYPIIHNDSMQFGVLPALALSNSSYSYQNLGSQHLRKSDSAVDYLLNSVTKPGYFSGNNSN
jgi:hypothetical protein